MAKRFAHNALRQHFAALGHWHRDHGFVDPTRATVVRNLLKSIQAIPPSTEIRTVPQQLTQLAQMADWLQVLGSLCIKHLLH